MVSDVGMQWSRKGMSPNVIIEAYRHMETSNYLNDKSIELLYIRGII